MSTVEHPLRVGFIGLGDQGGPMATAIAEAGHTLVVWARRPESLTAIDGVPHLAAASVGDLARGSDVVALCLRDDVDVWDVLDEQGLLEAARPGTVIVNHGTGDPAESERIASHVASAGAAYLDAPVSGGRIAALERRLTTFVGGDEAAFRRALPVFATFSLNVRRLGGPGRGQLTKLLNNALTMTNLKNAIDVLAMARTLGFDLPEFATVIATSSGNSAMLQFAARPLDPDLAVHLQGLMRKDIGHFADAVRANGIDPTDVFDRGLAGANGITQLAVAEPSIS